jgi:hypothetical protein
MVERILDRLSEWLPDLRECIVERAAKVLFLSGLVAR